MVMKKLPVEEPLAEILKSYCNINAFELVDRLAEGVHDGRIRADKAALFEKQLSNAIENETISPSQYKALTGDNEYNTQEELQAWLRELYEMIFGENKS
jgi:hypothetical protein